MYDKDIILYVNQYLKEFEFYCFLNIYFINSELFTIFISLITTFHLKLTILFINF